eukprot:m.31562 g.31562  ORF g.31562 m.31562 type:complete len:854 (-) comp4811_c0_seq1:210-2771(-)
MMAPQCGSLRSLDGKVSLMKARKATEAHDREPARLRRRWANPPLAVEGVDFSVRVIGYMLTENEYLIGRAVTEQLKTNEQAAHLIKIIDENGALEEFLLYTIRDELDRCGQAQMVFRRNSGRSRVLSAFLKMTGSAILGEILAPTVKEVVAMPPLDIDQNRQPGFGDAQIVNNAQGLEALCGDLLKRMHDRLDTFPAPLKSFARVLYSEANKKFPACGQDVLITVLFLRFVCPAIVTPWAFDVVDQQLHPLHGRSLILISKLLQMTCVMSGGDSDDRTKTFVRREECMACFRSFVDKEREGIKTMCQKLSGVSTDGGVSQDAAAAGPDTTPADNGQDDAMLASGADAETDDPASTPTPPAVVGAILSDEILSDASLWTCPTPRCRELNFATSATCTKCLVSKSEAGERAAYAADGMTPVVRAVKSLVQFCKSVQSKVSAHVESEGPTECTMQFSPAEILQGAADDVLLSVDAEYDDFVMTEMYDVLESELVGGGNDVTTLASIVADTDMHQLDSVMKATLQIACGLGVGGKLVQHILDVAQAEALANSAPPTLAAGSNAGGEDDARSVHSSDGGRRSRPVSIHSVHSGDHNRPISRMSTVSMLSASLSEAPAMPARMALEYAMEGSRAGVTKLVGDAVSKHLRDCQNFDAVNTMDPRCKETQMVDAFVCQVVEGIFVDRADAVQPLHFAARLLTSVTSLESDNRVDIRSFYGRAVTSMVYDAIIEQGSRTRGLARIVKRALKHTFAGNVIDESRLIGLCEGFHKMCDHIDTMIMAAALSATVEKAAAAEHCGGVPPQYPLDKWCLVRESALCVLAARCSTAVPSRPMPRSDTIPYNAANHFKIALGAVSGEAL